MLINSVVVILLCYFLWQQRRKISELLRSSSCSQWRLGGTSKPLQRFWPASEASSVKPPSIPWQASAAGPVFSPAQKIPEMGVLEFSVVATPNIFVFFKVKIFKWQSKVIIACPLRNPGVLPRTKPNLLCIRNISPSRQYCGQPAAGKVMLCILCIRALREVIEKTFYLGVGEDGLLYPD